MANFRLTELADHDLLEIAAYTRDRWGDEQCQRYIHELFELFTTIADNPSQSTDASFIRVGLRKRLHPNRLHGIYYRIGGDGVVEILRVLHTKQDS